MSDIERMLNFSQEVLAIFAWDGTIQAANRTFDRIFNAYSGQSQAVTLLDIFSSQEYPHILDALQILQHGHPVIERISYLQTGEQTLPVKWSAYPDCESHKIYFVGDIKSLQIGSEQKLRLAIDIAPVAMVVVGGDDGSIKMINDLCLQMFGYETEEIIGQQVEILMPSQFHERHHMHREAYLDAMRMRPMGTGHMFYGRRKSGDVFALDIGLNPLQTETGILVVSSLLDVTQHESLSRKLLHQIEILRAEITGLKKIAAEDELTKIPNRRTLMKQMQLMIYEAYEGKTPLAVAMLDIDKFKDINDQYGHLVGDAVLFELAQKIRKELRTKDVLSRYGGDEFALLLPETTTDQAFGLLERVRLLIESSAMEIPVHISVGCSIYQPEISDIPSEMMVSELLLKADIALYRAKQLGRNRVVIYETLENH